MKNIGRTHESLFAVGMRQTSLQGRIYGAFLAGLIGAFYGPTFGFQVTCVREDGEFGFPL